MSFYDVAVDQTKDHVMRGEYASVVRGIRKFIAQAEGAQIQEIMQSRLDMEIERMKELAREAYMPEHAAELETVAGRIEVLEWLTNGQFGFASVEV